MEQDEIKQSSGFKWLPCIIGFSVALLLAWFLYTSSGEPPTIYRGAFADVDFADVLTILTAIFGIVLLGIAYIIRKDAPAIAIFFIVCAILLQVIANVYVKPTLEPTRMKATTQMIHTR